jgi:hypothetical protein
MVGRPAGRLRIDALKAHLAKVELLDEGPVTRTGLSSAT